jgi:hypothetical protein
MYRHLLSLSFAVTLVAAGCHDLDRNRHLGSRLDGPVATSSEGSLPPADGRADVYYGGADADADGATPQAPDGAPPPADAGPAMDLAPSPEGAAPQSSYGTTCNPGSSYRPGPSGPKMCLDGVTVCVEMSPGGFCTVPCQPKTPCPPAQSGTQALCIPKSPWESFCVFVCLDKGQTYACPPGLSCKPQAPGLSYCRP